MKTVAGSEIYSDSSKLFCNSYDFSNSIALF